MIKTHEKICKGVQMLLVVGSKELKTSSITKNWTPLQMVFIDFDHKLQCNFRHNKNCLLHWPSVVD